MFLFCFFLDFLGVFDFLNVLLIFVDLDDVWLFGNVFVIVLWVLFVWVNFLVILFLFVLWLIGVIDVCDVIVVIGWV